MDSIINKKEVAILLSTYNSEKFLIEQINSIIEQSYKNWTLYIRDDGSTDNTLNIIKSYSADYENIVLCRDDKSNVGAANSFMKLLERVHSDYYMFCDHDDVWLKDKVEKEIERITNLEKSNPNVPILVGTDLIVVDKDLNNIADSLFKYASVDIDLFSKNNNFIYVMNPFVGCTLIFNNVAKCVSLPMSQNSIMHDWWLALCVKKANGIIDIINQGTILYRQHGRNVVGTKRISLNSKEYWLTKLKNIKDVFLLSHSIVLMLKDLNLCSSPYYFWLKINYIIRRKS